MFIRTSLFLVAATFLAGCDASGTGEMGSEVNAAKQTTDESKQLNDKQHLEVAEYEDRIAKLNKSLTDATSEVRFLRDANKKLESAKNDLEKRLETSETALKSSQEELAETTATLDQIANLISDLQGSEPEPSTDSEENGESENETTSTETESPSSDDQENKETKNDQPEPEKTQAPEKTPVETESKK